MPVSILWIEDERHRVERLGDLLREEIDCSITFSEDGTDTIQKLYEGNFNLLILDIMMPLGGEIDPSIEPKRTGIEILRMIRSGKIRDKEIDKEIPVIAVTAVSNRSDKEAVIKLSVSDYLLKPVRAEVLIHAVKTALSGSRKSFEYEDRLDELIANFDVETDVLSSPIDFLKRLASTLHSETAFIAMPNVSSGFDIPYAYTENDCMRDVKTITRSSTLSEVIRRNKAVTVNEENDIDDELRELGVKSMLAVPFPLPDKTGALTVCNKRTPLKFGALYIGYDVKICFMIAFFISRGLQLFEAPFGLISRRLDILQSDVDELRDTVQELSEAVRGLAQMLDSEVAFIARHNSSGGFDIPYAYTENDCMKGVKTIARVGTLSEVIGRNEPITVNEENEIDDELRGLGVESMLAVPFQLPNEVGALAVCNKKTSLKSGAIYIDYDVKICFMIAFFISGGIQLFEVPFRLIDRKFDNLQSEFSELRNTVQELSEEVRTLRQPSHEGIVITDFVRERDTYLRMENELLGKYPEQFVAIYQGELVAVNSDKIKLIEEVQQKVGAVRAYIRKVTKELPLIKLPTSRRLP